MTKSSFSEKPSEPVKSSRNKVDWQTKWRDVISDVCKKKPNFKLYLGSCLTEFEAPSKLIINVGDSMTFQRMKNSSNYNRRPTHFLNLRTKDAANKAIIGEIII